MNNDTPQKGRTSSVFSRFADLCAGPFRPSKKRITTHRFCQKKSVPQYSTLIHSRMDTCPVLVRTWWEAQKIEGADLYKIRRESSAVALQKLASYRIIRSEDLSSSPQDITWKGQKAVSLSEAIEALKDLETRAMSGQEFSSIDEKQPLAKYHWSKLSHLLPQEIVKSAPSIRLKTSAPETPKRR